MSLNELLAERKMSKYRLWKQSGVPQATISDICTGKTKIEKCSAETVYRIAAALDIPMEQLIAPALSRPSFEQFRSNTCHKLKDMGDIPFLIQLLKSNEIRRRYQQKQYPEALYLLALLDYLSRLNHIALCTNYQDIRQTKLRSPLYPAGVLLLCKALNSEAPKEELLHRAIPEFLRFNIIESEVRDGC